jgi:recombinational DNA repair protein RecT
MSEEKANMAVEKYLATIQPIEIAASDRVSKKFIDLYDLIHGKGRGESMYQKERFNFEKLLQENPALQECTKLSLYGAFLDIAVNGLSLEPSKPLCYLIPRSCKSGRKTQEGKDIYEKRVSVSITGPGELVMRMRSGQINHADNPVVVYGEYIDDPIIPNTKKWIGDTFSVKLDDNGMKKVTYEACIPRQSNKIVGAFIRIVRNDGTVDYQWLLENDIDRLKSYSAKSNSFVKNGQRVVGDANALFSSLNGGIDSGFLENKMIKHAFDSYPKVRTGNFTQLETSQEPAAIDYGIPNDKKEIDHAINTVDANAEDVTDQTYFNNSEPAEQQNSIQFKDDGGSF